ncbi:hypothetical protein JTB14_022073 [Gonioctena quinquepunctata]|nr:hypothetical protein JTB14_022073 [Gonioctena quinquepunctata]
MGSLIHLCVCTRPDIACAVGKVSHFLEKRIHWNMVKRIMKYLKGSMNLGIQFKADEEMILKGFSDADYAADTTTKRSISGYIFNLRNSPILCGSQKQHSVSLSTTEA